MMLVARDEQWPRRSVAGFSPRRPWLCSGALGFVVDEMAVSFFFSEHHGFPLSLSFHMCTIFFLSLVGWRVEPLESAVLHLFTHTSVKEFNRKLFLRLCMWLWNGVLYKRSFILAVQINSYRFRQSCMQEFRIRNTMWAFLRVRVFFLYRVWTYPWCKVPKMFI